MDLPLARLTASGALRVYRLKTRHFSIRGRRGRSSQPQCPSTRAVLVVTESRRHNPFGYGSPQPRRLDRPTWPGLVRSLRRGDERDDASDHIPPATHRATGGHARTTPQGRANILHSVPSSWPFDRVRMGHTGRPGHIRPQDRPWAPPDKGSPEIRAIATITIESSGDSLPVSNPSRQRGLLWLTVSSC